MNRTSAPAVSSLTLAAFLCATGSYAVDLVKDTGKQLVQVAAEQR